jgi:hypothetical protein
MDFACSGKDFSSWAQEFSSSSAKKNTAPPQSQKREGSIYLLNMSTYQNIDEPRVIEVASTTTLVDTDQKALRSWFFVEK